MKVVFYANSVKMLLHFQKRDMRVWLRNKWKEHYGFVLLTFMIWENNFLSFNHLFVI